MQYFDNFNDDFNEIIKTYFFICIKKINVKCKMMNVQ